MWRRLLDEGEEVHGKPEAVLCYAVQTGGGTFNLFPKNECSDPHVDHNRTTYHHKPVKKAIDAMKHTLELILQCHDLNPWDNIFIQEPGDTVDQVRGRGRR